LITILCSGIFGAFVSTARGAEELVDARSVLAKAKMAVGWVNWSESATDVDYIASSSGQPVMYAGFRGRIIAYRSADNRLHIKIEGKTPNSKGVFTEDTVREEFIAADRKLLSFVVGEKLPPGPRNGIIRIFRLPQNVTTQWEFAICGPMFAGFLDGQIEDNDGTGHSIFELAEQGNLSNRVTQESIRGLNCVVLSADTAMGKLHIWIVPSQAYNIARFKLEGSTLDSLGAPQPFSFSFETTKFQLVDKHVVIVGGKFENASFEKQDGRVWKSIATALRSNIKVDPVFTNPRIFTYADVPDGLKVQFDDLGPGITYVWQGGKPIPNVDEQTLQEITSTIQKDAAPFLLEPGSDNSGNLITIVTVSIGFAAVGCIAVGVLLILRARRKRASH